MPQMIFEDDDGTLSMLRDSVAAFAEGHPGAKVLRDRRVEGRDLDAAVWAEMAEAGWLGLTLPEDLGGSGLGAREQAVLSEALGRALLTEPVAQLAVFTGALVSRAAPSATRTALVQGIASGARIVAPAWRGRRGSAAPVPARRDGANLVLSGESHFVPAAASATDFLVLVEGDDGTAIVSVPADAPGLDRTLRPTVDGAALGRLSFDGVAVPEANVLLRGNAASAALEEAIDHTRIALAAELVGLAHAAVERTIAYTSERVQFGKPIAAFQVNQHRLVDMWTDAEFAAAAVVNAVEAQNGDPRDARLAILAAKARAGDAAVSICRRAIHLHGAMGFTDECDIGLYLKRALTLNASLGQPEELRLAFVALERAA